MKDKTRIKIGQFIVDNHPFYHEYMYAFDENSNGFRYLRPDGQVLGGIYLSNVKEGNVGLYANLYDIRKAYLKYLKRNIKFYGEDSLIYKKLLLLEEFLKENDIEISVNSSGNLTFQGMTIHNTATLPRDNEHIQNGNGQIRIYDVD